VLSGLEKTKVNGSQVNAFLAASGSAAIEESTTALSLLRRPNVELAGLLDCLGLAPGLNTRELLVLEAAEKYRGFWDRQLKEIERSRKLEGLRIPSGFDYAAAHALSIEARQKLAAGRPLTVGLAGKVSGVTPADISGLIFHINRPHNVL
jgi:tRNA uridine 5-carboxymethylaminomethyl modification enzyme